MGFRSGPASSSDMAALLSRAMQELRTPGGDALLSQPLAMVWTGHSERATLPSWLAAQGRPRRKEIRSAGGPQKDSYDYARNYKAVVRRLLKMIVRDIIAGVAFTTLDEQGCMDELQEAMVKTNVNKKQAMEEISALTAASKLWLVYVAHPSPFPGPIRRWGRN